MEIALFVWLPMVGILRLLNCCLADEEMDVNKANRDGNISLNLACYSGRTEVVKMLMADERIDINRTSEDGNSSLFFLLVLLAILSHQDVVNRPSHHNRSRIDQ